MHWKHVRMLQPSGESDLALETMCRETDGKIGPQHLDHDASAKPRIAGDEHTRHRAAAELALQNIGFAERTLQLIP
jgi:hypothetical protein